MKYAPAKIPKEYEEGYSNCNENGIADVVVSDAKFVDELAKSWQIIKGTMSPPTLGEYRERFQALLETKLDDFCAKYPKLKQKYGAMRNKKGDDKALLHLTYGFIRILVNCKEIRLFKSSKEEDSTYAY